MDGVDGGVLPGCGKFTGCETGVDKIKKDVTADIKIKPKDTDADIIGSRSRRKKSFSWRKGYAEENGGR